MKLEKKTKAELITHAERANGLHESDQKLITALEDKANETTIATKALMDEVQALRATVANGWSKAPPVIPVDPMTFNTFMEKTMVAQKQQVTDAQGNTRSVPTGRKVSRYTNKGQAKRDIRWVDTITCECGKVINYDRQLKFFCQMGMSPQREGQVWFNGRVWTEDTRQKTFTSPTATEQCDPFGSTEGVDGREEQFPTGNQEPAPFRNPAEMQASRDADPVLYLTQNPEAHNQGGVPVQGSNIHVPRK